MADPNTTEIKFKHGVDPYNAASADAAARRHDLKREALRYELYSKFSLLGSNFLGGELAEMAKEKELKDRFQLWKDEQDYKKKLDDDTRNRTEAFQLMYLDRQNELLENRQISAEKRSEDLEGSGLVDPTTGLEVNKGKLKGQPQSYINSLVPESQFNAVQQVKGTLAAEAEVLGVAPTYEAVSAKKLENKLKEQNMLNANEMANLYEQVAVAEVLFPGTTSIKGGKVTSSSSGSTTSDGGIKPEAWNNAWNKSVEMLGAAKENIGEEEFYEKQMALLEEQIIAKGGNPESIRAKFASEPETLKSEIDEAFLNHQVMTRFNAYAAAVGADELEDEGILGKTPEEKFNNRMFIVNQLRNKVPLSDAVVELIKKNGKAEKEEDVFSATEKAIKAVEDAVEKGYAKIAKSKDKKKSEFQDTGSTTSLLTVPQYAKSMGKAATKGFKEYNKINPVAQAFDVWRKLYLPFYKSAAGIAVDFGKGFMSGAKEQSLMNE